MSMDLWVKRVAWGVCAAAAVQVSVAGDFQQPPFVRGGQFKDLILPVPMVDGLESEGIWGNENVVPRDADNGIEDAEWCYWGGNPVMGHDGNYHIAICRWPENTGHHGWFESEVAHCVSDNPIGPYKITKTIVKKGHNPEVMVMKDGTYVLHLMNTHVYQADAMAGPWKRIGQMRFNSRGFLPADPNRLGSNLTTEFRPDGSILLMKKDGFTAVSKDGILGPFLQVSRDNYLRNSGYAEDPVIWRSRHQFHCIYNHAQDRKSAYMRSLDGIHWKNEMGLPYDVSTTFYEDGTQNKWYKFERPKVLQDQLGRASHLSLAVMDVSKGADKGNDNHSSKNMIMPLVTEKLIFIEGDAPITAATKEIAVRIRAEEGFDPVAEVNVDSLRFGSDSVVNHGGGCVAVKSKADGKDLLVLFKGENGRNRFDYDFKLIGHTKADQLVMGYALLPDASPMDASLITLPLKVSDKNGLSVLESAVENWGLTKSAPLKVAVMEYDGADWTTLQTVHVPALEPYDSETLNVELKKRGDGLREFALKILDYDPRVGYWKTVDDQHTSVTFSGSWKPRAEAQPLCFMGNELVTETAGDSVTFTFTGTRARAYGFLGNKMGAIDVYIDGKFVENVRLSFGGPHSRIYQTPPLPEGKHMLELRAAKAKHERTNSTVSIDAFAFESINNK